MECDCRSTLRKYLRPARVYKKKLSSKVYWDVKLRNKTHCMRRHRKHLTKSVGPISMIMINRNEEYPQWLSEC